MLLAAGELVWLALGEVLHADRREGLGDALLPLLATDLADIEPKRDVVGDGHVRPQRVALEHHAGVALVGGEEGDVAGLAPFDEEQPTGRGLDEPSDHAEKGGLAAAGGPQEEEELARFYFERDSVHGGGGSPADPGKGLGDLVDGDGGAGVGRVCGG